MRYAAFLKAINVGGHTVTMESLRAILSKAGFKNVETVIASGNVLFEASSSSAAKMEKEMAAALASKLGYAVPTFVRTLRELEDACLKLPFKPTVVAKAKTINVGFLDKPLGAEALAKLAEHNTALDSFHAKGREFFWLSMTGMSESPFFKVRFDKAFGSDITMRNLNTVRKIIAKLSSG